MDHWPGAVKKECLSLYLVMSFAETDVGTASSDNN
jgi:hypothetical protein